MNKEVKRVGIIGGGQLAWMMADAAQKLGMELIIQTPSQLDPAVSIASDTIFAQIDDASATETLATCCDVVTFENEFIDLIALSDLAKSGVCFRPSLTVLSPLLDKYAQRCYLRDIGLPVPQFTALETDAQTQITEISYPVVLKARRHGYDGQGTFIIKSQEELQLILNKLGNTPVLLEEFVPFERELAIIAARSVAGDIVIYPVVETQQENQVCHRVFVPANLTSSIQLQVEAIAHTLLNSLEAVGIFGIELFLTSEGKVLVNEIAPRTHNSGHFSLDACQTSQFEMHLRAVSGLPLGNPDLHCQGAVMVNLLGFENSQSDYQEKRQQLANLPNAFVHWYGKTESRLGRKLGHVTVLLDTDNNKAAVAIAEKIESIWYS